MEARGAGQQTQAALQEAQAARAAALNVQAKAVLSPKQWYETTTQALDTVESTTP